MNQIVRKIEVKYYKHFLAFGVILFFCILFHYRLFFPQLSLYSTPDFGESDLLHGYYPVKYVLSESLKNNKLPLWSSYMNGGYPLFADGQIGALNIQNLVLYKFLPFNYAINIGYILMFWFAGIGAYLFSREYIKDTKVNIFISIVYVFSGFNINQITHISLLQSSTFLPFVLLMSHQFLKNKISLNVIILSLIIISQQLFTGNQEIFIYTILTSYVYIILFVNFSQRQNKYKFLLRRIFWWTIIVLISVILSSALIFPSIELFLKSGYGLNEINRFSYHLKDLLLFLNPFYYGSPSKGTYPIYNRDWGIFWENSGYVGLIPLILIAFSIVKLKSRHLKIFLSIILLLFLFAFGDSSPLYFIFSIPPLSFFRVPSRILMSIDLIIALYSGYTLFLFRKQLGRYYKLFTYVLIILQFINIAYYFLFYHPVKKADTVYPKSNQLKKIIHSLDKSRIITINPSDEWNKIFNLEGWTNVEKYNSFADSLINHSNVIYGVSKSYVNVPFSIKRVSVTDSFIQTDLSDNGTLFISSDTASIINSKSIQYLFTPKNIHISNLPKVEVLQESNVYYNPSFYKRARIVFQYHKINNLDEFAYILENSSVDLSVTALIEKDLKIDSDCKEKLSCYSNMSWKQDDQEKIVLEYYSNHAGILILSDTFFPGWHAYVDGENTEIFPVNIDQRGILIPKGKHAVVFEFRPTVFIIGLIVSLFSYLICILLLVYGVRVRQQYIFRDF